MRFVCVLVFFVARFLKLWMGGGWGRVGVSVSLNSLASPTPQPTPTNPPTRRRGPLPPPGPAPRLRHAARGDHPFALIPGEDRRRQALLRDEPAGVRVPVAPARADGGPQVSLSLHAEPGDPRAVGSRWPGAWGGGGGFGGLAVCVPTHRGPALLTPLLLYIVHPPSHTLSQNTPTPTAPSSRARTPPPSR